MDSHSFSLRIIRARNIYLKSSRELFIRCYLPAGSSKRVRLDSQQISSNSNLIWNQTFSLDCSGNEEALKQGTVVFELRCRNSRTFAARMSGSKLLARAEMPWNDVVGTEVEKWVVMMPENRHVHGRDVKPPVVQIAMKVEESAGVKKVWDDSCGCMETVCNSCVDYEFFALGAALEAF